MQLCDLGQVAQPLCALVLSGSACGEGSRGSERASNVGSVGDGTALRCPCILFTVTRRDLGTWFPSSLVRESF